MAKLKNIQSKGPGSHCFHNIDHVPNNPNLAPFIAEPGATNAPDEVATEPAHRKAARYV